MSSEVATGRLMKAAEMFIAEVSLASLLWKARRRRLSGYKALGASLGHVVNFDAGWPRALASFCHARAGIRKGIDRDAEERRRAPQMEHSRTAVWRCVLRTRQRFTHPRGLLLSATTGCAGWFEEVTWPLPANLFGLLSQPSM